MNRLTQIKTILKKHKAIMRDQFNVKSLAVFGSYVRGEQHKKSDIDILVEFSKT